MQVVFFSSTLSHHQLPFCQECERILGIGNFTFVASLPLTNERCEQGFPDYNSQFNFVLRLYENSESYQKAYDLCQKADVVIFGVGPEEFVRNRIKKNKLTFRYQERIFKMGRGRILNPRMFLSLFLRHAVHYSKNLYMLCASSYTSGDYKLAFSYIGKCYRFGYFPPFVKQDIDMLLLKKPTERIRLLWVGRLIPLKHPEKIIILANQLLKNKYEFEIIVLGDGPERTNILHMIDEFNLSDYVHLIGSRPHDEVRQIMDVSNIFLFTSDKQEGWGVVLNEAMNSGCAAVVSNQIGSVAYLVKDKFSGSVFDLDDDDDFIERVQALVKDKQYREFLGRNAYKNISETWNAAVAAERFCLLSKRILEGLGRDVYQTGPMSIDN